MHGEDCFDVVRRWSFPHRPWRSFPKNASSLKFVSHHILFIVRGSSLSFCAFFFGKAVLKQGGGWIVVQAFRSSSSSDENATITSWHYLEGLDLIMHEWWIMLVYRWNDGFTCCNSAQNKNLSSDPSENIPCSWVCQRACYWVSHKFCLVEVQEHQ